MEVTVEAQDVSGKPLTLEGSGLLVRIFQPGCE
jgi:peptide deformylase